MSRLAVVELQKDELKFSAGHFMFLSATKRESMHGHDYQVQVAFHTLIQHNGMGFDCREYKKKLLHHCQTLDYHYLVPSLSEYMQLEESDEHCLIHFANQTISLLKKDVVILPICNITLEELSHWFIQQLTQDQHELQTHGIQGIAVKIFNGRGESAETSWFKSS